MYDSRFPHGNERDYNALYDLCKVMEIVANQVLHTKQEMNREQLTHE